MMDYSRSALSCASNQAPVVKKTDDDLGPTEFSLSETTTQAKIDAPVAGLDGCVSEPTPAQQLDQANLELIEAFDRDNQSKTLDISLAPGCYGMSLLRREGSTECSTCPFAPPCKPAGEQQLAMLRAEGCELPIERERREARERKRAERAKEKARATAPVSKAPVAPEPSATPPLSISKAMLLNLQKAVANRRPNDRRLEKLMREDKQKELVKFAILLWTNRDLSVAKVGKLYTAKTSLPMDKKPAENRKKLVDQLVAAGIWTPIQSGAKP